MSEIDWGPLAVNLVGTAVTVTVVMLVTFAIGSRMRRHSIIDIVWGIGFTVIAWVTVVLASSQPDTGRVRLIAVLTTVWGLRLAGWLAWRNRGIDDARYIALLRRAKGNPNLYVLRTVHLTQGTVMWIVSLPVQFAGYERGTIGAVAYAGIALWTLGVVFESVGDFQLARFKRDPQRTGGVMDCGLWRYTRHPNYFGDACVWWGIFLVALGHPIVAISAVGPALMTHFLLNRSGKALLERHLLRTRPDYAAYVDRTSGFVPRPPRARAYGDR
jgi:steroid 5-alpha reductase family enzyme